MSEPELDAAPDLAPNGQSEPMARPGRNIGLIAFLVLSAAWLGFLALGQVNARFWISNEHQVAYKSIRGIWRVQLGELPGGSVVQWVFAGSMLVIAFGVIATLYVLLVASYADDVDAPER